MAMKKDIKIISDLLSSDQNADLSAEEVAELVIDTLDEHRKADVKFYSVVQIVTERGPGRPYIIGPVSTYLRASQAGEMPMRGWQDMGKMGIQYRHMVGYGAPGTGVIPQWYQPMKEETQTDRSNKKLDARRAEAKAVMQEMHAAGWPDDEIASAYGCSEHYVRMAIEGKKYYP